MEQNEFENNDSEQIVEEEVSTEETPEETTDWKAEALKYKAIAERAKKKVSKTLTEKAFGSDIEKDVQELKLEKVKREFSFTYGLSPDETDQVFRLDPNPTEETLKSAFVKGGLEKIRTQKRLESNTPSPSGGSFVSNGKSWGEMDKDEQARNYPAYIQALSKQRRG